MGIGAITLPNAGSVTEPTDALKLELGAAFSTEYELGLPISVVDVPHRNVVVHTNGVGTMRHLLEAAIFRTGLLAPKSAMVGTPSGIRATAILDIDDDDNGTPYTVLNNDGVYFPNKLGDLVKSILFKSTLPSAGSDVAILIVTGGTAAQNAKDTLDNFVAFINQTGTEGVDYYSNGEDVSALVSAARGSGTPGDFRVTLTFGDFGTVGNSYRAGLFSGFASDSSYGSTTTTVGTVGFFENGADGSGTEPAAGTYKHIHQGYRKEDGALSGASPASDAANNGGPGDIDLTGMVANPDSTAGFTRWSRTLKGQARFYRGAEIARAGTTDTDDKSDTDLTQGGVIYQQRKHRSYRAGHIPRYRWVVEHHGRIFAGGAIPSAPYSAGTATVNNGSDEVTISGGYPLASHEGRTYRTDDTSEAYLIVAVDVTNKKYTLDRDYEGANVAGGAYTTKDDRNADDVNFTETGLHNQLPATNHVSGVVSRAGEGSLQGISIWEALLVFTRDGVWRLIGENRNSYALRPVAGAAGVLSSRSVVEVDGVLFWSAPSGIYRWDGQSAPQNLARPPVEDGIVRGINETIKRINHVHASQAHSHYAQDEKVVRFFVPLDDEVVPGHAIVLDLQTGAFALDRVPDITAAGTVTKPNGDRVTVLGSVTGELFHVDIGDSDGAFGFEPKTTATSATRRTWTDSGASFPTTGDGLAGVPFWFVDAAGNFDRRVIASNTSSMLTFTLAFDTTPSVGWQGYCGGIGGHFRSGRAHYGVPDEDKGIALLDFMYSPESDGTGWVAVATNQGALAIPGFSDGQVDMSDVDGHTRIVWGGTGRAHQFEFWGVEPGAGFHILSIKSHVNSRNRLARQV